MPLVTPAGSAAVNATYETDPSDFFDDATIQFAGGGNPLSLAEAIASGQAAELAADEAYQAELAAETPVTDYSNTQPDDVSTDNTQDDVEQEPPTILPPFVVTDSPPAPVDNYSTPPEYTQPAQSNVPTGNSTGNNDVTVLPPVIVYAPKVTPAPLPTIIPTVITPPPIIAPAYTPIIPQGFQLVPPVIQPPSNTETVTFTTLEATPNKKTKIPKLKPAKLAKIKTPKKKQAVVKTGIKKGLKTGKINSKKIGTDTSETSEQTTGQLPWYDNTSTLAIAAILVIIAVIVISKNST